MRRETIPGRRLILPLMAATLLAACSNESVSPNTTASTTPTTTTSTSAADPVTTLPNSTTVTTQAETPTADLPIPQIPDQLVATPAQTEGPFYPVEKPTDRDNDLLVVDGDATLPAGVPLELVGVLVDDTGTPIEGATVEIWQVDSQGIYDHPGDRGTEDRDPNFQFYGEAVTDGDGLWRFLTIRPVPYEPRPAHIHAKVLIEGEERLTTQIYFADDQRLESDGPASQAGSDIDLLTTTPIETQLSNGLPGLYATHIIVLGS